MKTRKKQSDKIHVVTLGCSKNTVDSERLIRQLTAHSLEVEHDSDNSDARTIIINTCGFINDAKQESIDTILQYANAKKAGKIDHLFVMGCLSERYRDDLIKEIPEADNIFGVNDIAAIIEAVGYNYRQDLIGERHITTPPHYAYFKISEGCNRKCSFCAIPLIRGKHISVAVESLVQEAKYLASIGVKELMFIAQDLSSYGYDIAKKSLLKDLLQQVSEINGIEWIRLHYAYPQLFPDEVIELMAKHKKICHYLDIPVQHCNDRILKQMKRGHTHSQTLELINKFRQQIPDIALRTSLIVGFPGESDKDFDELCEFVKTSRFDRLGVFAYSPEEQTYAGENYVDDVPDAVKLERASTIMDIQRSISLELNTLKIGSLQKVIIDKKEGDQYIGRTQYDSPDVDNEVLIETKKELNIGLFYTLKIIGANEFDLIAEFQ